MGSWSLSLKLGKWSSFQTPTTLPPHRFDYTLLSQESELGGTKFDIWAPLHSLRTSLATNLVTRPIYNQSLNGFLNWWSLGMCASDLLWGLDAREVRQRTIPKGHVPHLPVCPCDHCWLLAVPFPTMVRGFSPTLKIAKGANLYRRSVVPVTFQVFLE